MSVVLVLIGIAVLIAITLASASESWSDSREIVIVRPRQEASGCAMLSMFALGVLIALLFFALLATP
jgi:hypothetical protein